jgi:hypothetical protein
MRHEVAMQNEVFSSKNPVSLVGCVSPLVIASEAKQSLSLCDCFASLAMTIEGVVNPDLVLQCHYYITRSTLLCFSAKAQQHTSHSILVLWPNN